MLKEPTERPFFFYLIIIIHRLFFPLKYIITASFIKKNSPHHPKKYLLLFNLYESFYFRTHIFQYKNDKSGIVHAGIGKLNFKNEDLFNNLKTFYDTILKSKPEGAKGSFIKKVTIASTMGCGLELNVGDLR